MTRVVPDVHLERPTLECNNRCVFCAFPTERVIEVSDTSITSSGDNLGMEVIEVSDTLITWIVGGEPLLEVGAVLEGARRARAEGARHVGVQTNGRLLDAAMARELAAAGVTHVQLSLHGAEARVHDWHTGVEGSFERVVGAMDAARAAGLAISVVTVLTRSVFRVLAPIPALLRAHGVSAWSIEVVRIAGRAEEALDRVVPRLGLALPFALHAIESARALGVEAWIRGAPLCALGPLVSRAIRLEVAPDALRFAEKCDACEARRTCDGVDPIYLARFGDGELSPRPATEVALPLGQRHLSFPGVGSLAPRTVPDEAVPPAPAEVRRRLPMLGKVQPARAEVPRSEPKRTGEALRELFPQLFESKPDRE